MRKNFWVILINIKCLVCFQSVPWLYPNKYSYVSNKRGDGKIPIRFALNTGLLLSNLWICWGRVIRQPLSEFDRKISNPRNSSEGCLNSPTLFWGYWNSPTKSEFTNLYPRNSTERCRNSTERCRNSPTLNEFH